MIKSPFKIKEINMSSTWVYNVPKNNDCTICRCNLNVPSLYHQEKGIDSYVVIGKCLHSFHSECIKPWIEKNNHCPICSDAWQYNTPNNKIINNPNKSTVSGCDHESNKICPNCIDQFNYGKDVTDIEKKVIVLNSTGFTDASGFIGPTGPSGFTGPTGPLNNNSPNLYVHPGASGYTGPNIYKIKSDTIKTINKIKNVSEKINTFDKNIDKIIDDIKEVGKEVGKSDSSIDSDYTNMPPLSPINNQEKIINIFKKQIKKVSKKSSSQKSKKK